MLKRVILDKRVKGSIIISSSIEGIITGGNSVGSHVIFIVFEIAKRVRISSIIVSSTRGISVGSISVGGRVVFIFFVLVAILILRLRKER